MSTREADLERWGAYDMTSLNDGKLRQDPAHQGTKGECEAFVIGTDENQPTYDIDYEVRPLTGDACTETVGTVKTREQLEKELARIEADERLSYGAANMLINGPLAAIQIADGSRANAIRWVLGMDSKVYCKGPPA